MGKRRWPRILVAMTTVCCIAPLQVAAQEPSVRLGGPEIVKLDDTIRTPVAMDLDGNGMRDLALINNDRARIDLLYRYAPDEIIPEEKEALEDGHWRPELDRGRFFRRGIPTGERMYAAAAGDFDGDGHPDLAYTAAEEGLKILYQRDLNDWQHERVYDRDDPGQWGSSLRAADLDGNGELELVMLGRDTLVVFSRGASGLHDQVRRYPLGEEDSFGLTLADVDHDQRMDILYLARNSRFALKLRIQDADGGFGAEIGLELDTPRGEAALTVGEHHTEIAVIDRKSGMVKQLRLTARETDGNRPPTLRPVTYNAPTKAASSDAYAMGDFDGDGDSDIALADREGALIWLYRRLDNGRFSEPRSYPAFAGIHSLHARDLDGDDRDELYLAAGEEEGFGVTRLSEEGRFLYPQPIGLEGVPLAVAALSHPVHGGTLVCLVKRKRTRGIALLRKTATPETNSSWTEYDFIPLTDLKGDPSGMQIIDFDGDDRDDILVFAPRAPAIPLLGQDDGRFLPLDKASGFRPGLFDNLEPRDVTLGDVDGDGENELLVSGKGSVKVITRKAAGVGSVRDQFSPLNREAEVSSVVLRDIDGDGTRELLLKLEKSNDLEIHQRDQSGVYRYNRSMPLGAMEVLVTRSANSMQELLYFGRSGFFAVSSGASEPALTEIAHYESPVEEVEYGKLAFGDVNGDGSPELVVQDDRNSRVLDVLHKDGEKWASTLRFAVFEQRVDDAGQGGAREPHDLLIEDLDGDGLDDIILLAHDRMLFYPALSPTTP